MCPENKRLSGRWGQVRTSGAEPIRLKTTGSGERRARAEDPGKGSLK